MKKFCSVMLFLLAVLPLFAYEVIVFGDVHFDSDSVRSSKEKRPKYQLEETKRNLHHWSQTKEVPALLDRAAKTVNPDTALVVQLGDIVQGDFGGKRPHQKALGLVLAEFRQRFPEPLPFVMIPGNHDYRGPKARDGYQAFAVPYLNKTLNLSLSPGAPVQYLWTRDRDLFVMLDCNLPDPSFLEQAVTAHPDLRHLVVLTHFPIIPTSYPGTVYWQKMSPAARRKFIALLAKHHAVVLTAHIHHTTRIKWQCPEGSIIQLSLFSIFNAKEEAHSITKRAPENPLPEFSAPQQKKFGSKVKIIQSEFLPGYRFYEVVRPSAGFAVLKLDDHGVSAELHLTKSLTPTATLQLK